MRWQSLTTHTTGEFFASPYRALIINLSPFEGYGMDVLPFEGYRTVRVWHAIYDTVVVATRA